MRLLGEGCSQLSECISDFQSLSSQALEGHHSFGIAHGTALVIGKLKADPGHTGWPPASSGTMEAVCSAGGPDFKVDSWICAYRSPAWI